MRLPSIIASLLCVVMGSGAFAAEPEGLKVDKEKKSVTIDAKVAPRKLPKLDQIYPIEVIACWPTPKGLKAHETIVTIDVNPSDVHKALESLGLKPGKPVKGSETEVGTGPDVNIFIELLSEGTVIKRLGMDKVLLDPKTKKPFPKSVKFRFTGSVMSKLDPTKPETKYGADMTGTLIAVYPVTDETVIQSSLTAKEEKFLKLEVNSEALPKEGTPVKLVIEAAK
jgi:hypothetical protein